MERVIRVRDVRPWASGGGVFLTLRDLLPHFKPEGHRWTWAVQREPELVAHNGWDEDFPKFRGNFAQEPSGVVLTLAELTAFGFGVQQVIWGEFIAAEVPAGLPAPTTSAEEVGQNATAGLAAIDSSFWLVGGPRNIVERIASSFTEVDELSPSAWHRADD